MSRFTYLIFILAIIVSFFGAVLSIKNASLRGEEPRRAVIAYEALENEDYLKLTSYGIPYYNKPPLYFGVLAKSFQISGFSKLSLRVPGLMAILFICLVLVLFFRGKPVVFSMLAVVMYLSLFDFLFYQSVYAGEIDHFFSLLVFISFFFQYRWLTNRHISPLIWGSVFCVLAFLTKGLPALLFFYGGWGSMVILFWFKEKRIIISWKAVLLSTLIIGVGIFSFFGVYGWTGGNVQVLFLNLIAESGDKSLSSFNWANWLTHIVSFPLELIKYFLPWILLVFLIPGRIWKGFLEKHLLSAFSLSYLLINIIPYWLSHGSRGRYLLCLLPIGIIVVVSCFLSYWNSKSPIAPNKRQIIHYASKSIAFILIAGLIYLGIRFQFDIVILVLLLLSIVTLLFSFLRKDLMTLDYLLSIALSLFVLKVAFAQTVLAVKLNSEIQRKEIVEDLLHFSDENPIYLSGAIESKEIGLDLLGLSIKDELYAPVYPSFEIPYYYILNKKQSIRYKSYANIGDELFILNEKGYYKDNRSMEVDSLYSFMDDWRKIKFYLAKK